MKCPVCSKKIPGDNQRLCERCGWEFDRYVTELSSRERELYDRKLGLARQTWKGLLQAREDAARLEKELEQERENARQARQEAQSLENTLKEREKALRIERERAEKAERDAQKPKVSGDELQALIDDYEEKLRKEQKRANDALKSVRDLEEKNAALTDRQDTLQRRLDDATRNVNRLSDAVRLSPWNPLDWFRLLVWILLQPSRLEDYQAALTSAADIRVLRQTGSHMAMALSHIPIALILAWIYLKLPLLISTTNDKVELWILHCWQILPPAGFLFTLFSPWLIKKFPWLYRSNFARFFYWFIILVTYFVNPFLLYSAPFMVFLLCLDKDLKDREVHLLFFIYCSYSVACLSMAAGNLVFVAAYKYILKEFIVLSGTDKDLAIGGVAIIAGIAGVIQWLKISDNLKNSFPDLSSTHPWVGRVIFGLLVLYWAGLGAGLLMV